MDTSGEKIRLILHYDKGETLSQVTVNVNSVYGPDIVLVNHAQFGFVDSENFEVKDVPLSERPTVDKIMVIV